MKTIWLTSLESTQNAVKKLMYQMKTYGIEINGHFWRDDLKKMAWMSARDNLIDPKISMWAILGSKEEMLTPDTRYGLSLLAVTAQAQRGLNFPIMILQTEGELLSSDQLSTPLRGAELKSLSDPGLGAKLVAKIHTPAKSISSEYRLNVIGNEYIGQWFEVGPTESIWPGMMFGVTGAEITFHAVGPSGSLPQQTILNYPMQGIKLEMREKEYLAWGVQNELNAQTSYFVKVDGYPDSIVFGPYSTSEATDVYVLALK